MYRVYIPKRCPCHLAETNDCILCSQLSGKEFCDCINWKGVCIYQEFIWNNKKAKNERKNYLCDILEKKIVEEKIIIFKIKTSHKLSKELFHPGSYIFMRDPKCMQFYDTPMSIMDSNTEENWIKVGMELKGTKTTSISLLDSGDKILIRAPFWNGIWGLKNIYNVRNGNVIMIIRGIGQAPALPVIKKISSNMNKITTIIDVSPYKEIFIKDELIKYNCDIIESKMIDKGELTLDFKNIFMEMLDNKKYDLVYCAGPDILSYNVLELLDDKISFSSCNNARMCCGEGVCGSCTVKTNDHKLRRLCKLQTDPRFILRGRRKL